jgi:hypothetical protein
MIPYFTDIPTGFTKLQPTTQRACNDTGVFRRLHIHRRGGRESNVGVRNTRGADQERMCACESFRGAARDAASPGIAATRTATSPAGAPRETPGESSARWGDSATRNPDTPPPIGPTAARRSRCMADAGGSPEPRGIAAGWLSGTSGHRSGLRRSRRSRRTATTERSTPRTMVVSPLRATRPAAVAEPRSTPSGTEVAGARGRHAHPGRAPAPPWVIG